MHPLMVPATIMILIHVISSISQFAMTSVLMRFYKQSNMIIIDHRNKKRNKMTIKQHKTKYIGQQVRGKPQRIGKSIMSNQFAQYHKKKCTLHSLDSTTHLDKSNLQQVHLQQVREQQQSTWIHSQSKPPLYHNKVCYMSEVTKFDTDSFLIGVDNHSSVSISK